MGDYRGLLTPLEVALSLNLRCPNCGAKLNPIIDNPDWREHVVINVREQEASENARRIKRSRAKRSIIDKTINKDDGVVWVSNTEFIVIDY
jgi:hypothetical protein